MGKFKVSGIKAIKTISSLISESSDPRKRGSLRILLEFLFTMSFDAEIISSGLACAMLSQK